MSTPEERIATVETEVANMKTDIADMAVDIKTLLGFANRWKGAFAAVLGAGALIGALVGWFADKAWDLITRSH